MTFKRILAILLIFLLGVFGWFVLGQASAVRSHTTSYTLSKSINLLWGAPIVQEAPKLTVKVPGTDQIRKISPTKNHIQANIILDQRKKGLLWYPTYTVDFIGKYEVTNNDRISQDIRLSFILPSKDATYEKVSLKIGDREEIFNATTGIRLS